MTGNRKVSIRMEKVANLSHPREGGDPAPLSCAGIHNRQALEVRSIEAAVSAQKSISLAKGMRSDQEVRCNSRSRAATFPVSSPGDSGLESSFHSEGAKLKLEAPECCPRRLRRGEPRSNFCPHHLANNQPALLGSGAEGFSGGGTKGGISAQNVEQDIAVYGRDHFGLSLPRISSMISSVERSSFRIPYNSSIASRVGCCLDITKWPCSSRTSSTCPVRMPSRTRKGFGMVIWPFSETTVFIPRLYEFLPPTSRGRALSDRPSASSDQGVRSRLLIVES